MRRHPTPSRTSSTPPAAAQALRPQLEQARLDLRALFRALDRLRVAQDLPDELHDLFELDADFAEALSVLDHPPPGIVWAAMLRDTEQSLADLAHARDDFLSTLTPEVERQSCALAAQLRPRLTPENAAGDLPARPRGV